MNPTALIYLEFYMSLLTYALLARRYWIPAMRAQPFAAAVAPVLLLHSFRHLGMIYLNPAVIPDPPAAGFAEPTAWGDLATAALALLALGALRLDGLPAKAAVWAFNLVGVADLGLATVNAEKFKMLAKPIGVAFLLPVLVVPALLVTHGLVFWLLLRREPAAARTGATAAAAA